MSGSQKALKVISILIIICAVVQAIVGALFILGAQVPGVSTEVISVEDTSMSLSSASIAFGAGFLVNAVIYLIVAILGLRGAKDASKIGAFFVLCIIFLVVSLIGFGMSIAQNSANWTSFIDLVVLVICLVLAYNIKKDANRSAE